MFKPKARELIWMVALVPFLWAVGFTRTMGSDMWWHLASGRWMRSHGQVVQTDPYSWTFFGKPWVHHEWLGDIFLSLWVDLWSLESLIWWKWGLIIITHLLFFRVTVQLSEGRMFWPAVAVAAAAFTSCPFLDIRPQLYTFLGYGLLLALYWQGGKARWVIPPLLALWVNLHGGFIFGLMTLAVLVAPDFVDKPESRKPSALLFGASVLATGLNPHGFATTVFPFRYALQEKNVYTQITEWLSPLVKAGYEARFFPYLVVAFALVAGFWYLGSWRPIDLRMYSTLVLAVLTLCMALNARRFIPLFAFSSVLVLGPGMSYLTGKWKDKIPFALGPLGVFLLGCLCLAPFPKDSLAFGYMVSEDQYPHDLCDFMEKNKLEGKVFALYNYGGFLHYRSQGRWQVYIDGRADTVFGQQIYRDYQDVQNNKPMAPEIVEASGAEFFLWPFRLKKVPFRLLQSGKWKILYIDSVAILLGRADHDYGELEPPADSPYRLLARSQGVFLEGKVPEAAELARQSLDQKPTYRGFELLCAALLKMKKEQELEQTKKEWSDLYPYNHWFVKFTKP